ncbi:MAG: glycosyl hydrolase [Chitinophagaceae bacterium]|nr:glycosyl hydrolase [Chitinophagaceae bacterium]
MRNKIFGYLLIVLLSLGGAAVAQQRMLLEKNWVCINDPDTKLTAEELSLPGTKLAGWMPAIVPGTVLTNLLHNKRIPDPFFGYNNSLIPDISDIGRDYYTYWFVNDMNLTTVPGEHIWLTFRGVNYSFDVYVNGKKVNRDREYGMFRRFSYDITSYLATDGHNRVAVLVFPPQHVGNPNGGQGGDGVIARDVTNQYVAGWDWIQPVHDRNTGIWDKVFVERTKMVNIEDVHVVPHVPGKRTVDGEQSPGSVTVDATMVNSGDKALNAMVMYELQGQTASQRISLQPGERLKVELPKLLVRNPRLWWPNGYGPQNLYTIKLRVLVDGKGLSDEEEVTFGMRELTTAWNATTESREIHVNGQRIFIKGANRILSDAMLRFTDERYDAEVRYHRDMNLNMIRVWGGGITERPEFYEACDKYGLLVMQDLWMTGDCNGRWYDATKKDDTTTRRGYPDDHKLWLTSCADQVQLLRNHPSLALWCGGNEIRPPEDILCTLRDSLLPAMDGTRYFFEYSNHDSMSYKAHDGPYTIQKEDYFWNHRSWGFNSEIGSVGIGDIESLKRFMPEANLVQPVYNAEKGKWEADSMWRYHKYYSYDSAVEQYGHPKDVADFARKAQLVNYNQYRALMEGFRSHKWEWYTGVMIWKTQNPWTAMVGQMYDVYLDPNACMFGLMEGAKPLHVMYEPKWGGVMVVNSDHKPRQVRLWYSITKGVTSIQGINDSIYTIPPDTCIAMAKAPDLDRRLDKADSTSGAFMSLRLYEGTTKNIIDDNTYWFPGADSTYKWLSYLRPASLDVTATRKAPGRIEVSVRNRSDVNVSFFNHITLVDKATKKRILPVFYSNNFVTISPERHKQIVMEFEPPKGVALQVCIDEWNTGKRYVDVN